ncbi:hypothetical protein H2248_000217 [Termitomyces sp. 'cryptogamus']|nr:hypothetical protein H2248_000217 [Termitomyces sp. 'cryptogamus']
MTRILLLLFATLSLSSLVIGADEIFTLYRCGTSNSALGKKDKDLQRLKMHFIGSDDEEKLASTVVILKQTCPTSDSLERQHTKEENPQSVYNATASLPILTLSPFSGLSTFRDLGVEQFQKHCSAKGKFIWSIKSNEVSSVKDAQGRPIFAACKDYDPTYHVTIFLKEDTDDIGKVWDNLARLPWKKEGALKNLVPAVQPSTTMTVPHVHSSFVAAVPTATKSVSEQTTSGTWHKVVASGGQKTKRQFSHSSREVMLTRIAERRREREQKNVF